MFKLEDRNSLGRNPTREVTELNPPTWKASMSTKHITIHNLNTSFHPLFYCTFKSVLGLALNSILTSLILSYRTLATVTSEPQTLFLRGETFSSSPLLTVAPNTGYVCLWSCSFYNTAMIQRSFQSTPPSSASAPC
jgi:hypothetical protein